MRTRDAICITFGGAALATSVLAVGGVLRWTQAAVALLVAGALVCQLLSSRGFGRLSPLVGLLTGAALLSALQLIPLPGWILNAFNSTGHQLQLDGAALTGTHPWASLSLDPPETLRQTTFFVILIGVAMVALRYAASERGRFWMLAGVLITCTIAALVTGVHTLVNADALYGLYEPQFAKGQTTFGPLLNPNHLGCLMAIGVSLAVGLSFYHRQSSQARVVWVICGVTCAVVCAATFSRGAMIGMVLGLIVVATVNIISRVKTPKLERRSWRNNIPIFMVIGIGLAVALYFTADTVLDQLGETSLSEIDHPTSKYGAWSSSLDLIEEAPWFGIGRGATEAVLTRVHPGSARATFSHLENEYLSAVVEWGIVGGIVMALLVGWCLTALWRRRNDGPLAGAAIGALAAVTFQSLVDFGVELLGVAVPVTVIAATVQLVPLRPRTSRTRPGRALLIVALFGCAGVLLSKWTSSLREDDATLDEVTATLAHANSIIERHPNSYLGYGEAATIAWRNADPIAIPYLNHALRLHPTHPGLHRLAARLLIGTKHREQAALEYSVAMASEDSPRRMLEEIVALMPDVKLASMALPLDYPNVAVMQQALGDMNRLDIALAWLTRIARRPNPPIEILDRLYDLAISLRDVDTAWLAAELRWRQSRTTTSRLKRVQVMAARQQHDAVIKETEDIENWSGRIDERGTAWQARCEALAGSQQWEAALICMRHLETSGVLLTTARSILTKRMEEIKNRLDDVRRTEAFDEIEKALKDKRNSPPAP